MCSMLMSWKGKGGQTKSKKKNDKKDKHHRRRIGDFCDFNEFFIETGPLSKNGQSQRKTIRIQFF